MAISLANKYRPQTWEEVVSQKSVVTILKKQIETNTFKNAYIFCGSSGTGKTTLARIFAKEINKNKGIPIQIDAASNNGVDNVKNITKQANERSLDSEYKIYIIDECQGLTKQAWESFLKCIEEPPKYTIFIFCTTDPQKVPATILNRVQRFNLTRIPVTQSINRLKFICDQEGYTNYDESISYIAKICDGGLRDAIAMLSKCADYNTNLDIKNVLTCLGTFSYETLFKLVNSIIDGNEHKVLQIINDYYNQGYDLKFFVEQFIIFILDINKYIVFNTMDMLQIPFSFEESVKYSTAFDNASKYYQYLLDTFFELKQTLKNDEYPKSTVEAIFLKATRCQ